MSPWPSLPFRFHQENNPGRKGGPFAPCETPPPLRVGSRMERAPSLVRGEGRAAPWRAATSTAAARYALATVATGAAFLLRMALADYLGPPYILFYPTVLLVALLGGLGPGALATALAAVLVAFWILPAERQLPFMTLRDGVSLAAFFAMGLLMSLVAHRYRAARHRLALHARDLALREAEEDFRRREEEALRRYELLAANSRDIILFVRRDGGRVLEANAAATAAYGYTHAELQGLTIHELRAADAQVTSARDLAEADERGLRVETVHRRKDGAPFPVEVTSQGATLGGTRMLVSVIRDITARKQAEESLRESERRYSALFEKAPFAIALTEMPEGTTVSVNEAFLRLFEYSREEVIGKTSLDLGISDAASRAQVAAALERHDSIRDFECTRTTRSGTKHELSLSADRVSIGGKDFVLTSIQDITRRKRAEEELKERNDELVRFTYTVSHDLKSPLVTVRTFLGYLEQDFGKRDESSLREDFGHIRTAADRMSRLLDELLDLSRVGRQVNPSVRVPLQVVVGEALDLVAGRLAQRGVKVEVTEEPVVIEGDRPRLVEVFQNLLDNSAKFMGDQPSPRIEVGVDTGAGEPVLFVRDNGIGIDPRHKKKLFGLFEKLEPGTEGTGIGLAQVRRIVQIHGGRIWAESAGRGHGACFRFTLARTRRERGKKESA